MPRHSRRFRFRAFLARSREGRTIEFRRRQVLFSQGEPAAAVFYILKGTVKRVVVSKRGREAVIALLGPGAFFGEGCLTGQRRRTATATAVTHCTVVRLEKRVMIRLLQEQPALSALFVSYLLSRNVHVEENLVDQLVESSERRLARILLLRAHAGKHQGAQRVVPRISQETLAGMIGTTRARVSVCMNKFRKLGFIEYRGGLRVHDALLIAVLRNEIPT
ncbi:MAG TPA: Crp/Fnr family transcriptional regulator [bacterium]|nr:Crp/Fnr family transcriptional regulator [bacterium]